MDAPQLLAVRVSRRELALNRRVWLVQAAVFAMMSAGNVAFALAPLGFDSAHLYMLAGGFAAVTVAFLLTPPQPTDSLGNHLAVASAYVGTGVAMLAYAPQTSAPVAAVMFVGPLAAMRLVDRGEISAHLLAATACVMAPAFYADFTTQGLIGMATLVISVWVLGAYCAFVLETAEAQGEQLEQLVRRDPLTGLGNQRMLEEELARALRRHHRVRRPLSLLLIDLDGVKQANDTLGHAAGDDLLVRVAQALLATVPATAVVTRPGGDEFSIVLLDTPPQEAERVAAAVRAAIGSCGTTAAIGFASFPRDAVHDKVLVHVANERLQDDQGVPSANRGAAAAGSPLRILPDERESA